LKWEKRVQTWDISMSRLLSQFPLKHDELSSKTRYRFRNRQQLLSELDLIFQSEKLR